MDLFDSIVDDQVEEHVETSKCALNLASALDVDSDALVEEALELRLGYFGHLGMCTGVCRVLEDVGCSAQMSEKGWISRVGREEREAKKWAAPFSEIAFGSVPIFVPPSFTSKTRSNMLVI